MVSIRWQSFDDVRDELNRLRDEMDRWMGRSGASGLLARAFPIAPAVNLWEDDDHVYVESELPGVLPENLEIFVYGGNQLTLKGQRKRDEFEQANWLRRERQFGDFHRTVELPAEVDSERVAAEFRQGVLKITLPKREEQKPRRIEVKVG